MNLRHTSLFATSVLLLMPACTEPPATEGSTSDELRGTAIATQVTLLNEGSCQYLACASRYSDSVSCGEDGAQQCNRGCKAVHFGCSNAGTCWDDAVWIVRPRTSRTSCGQQLRVCYRGANVVVPVWDTSDANNHWEASPGLQDALGMPLNTNGRVDIYDADDANYQSNTRCGN